jgi:hypothetical protein
MFYTDGLVEIGHTAGGKCVDVELPTLLTRLPTGRTIIGAS